MLVVDDDDLLRECVVLILQREGYSVLSAARPQDALRIFEGKSSELALVLLDVCMPQMSGIELLTRLQCLRPDVPVLFITGCSSASLRDVLGDPYVAGVLRKPFTQRELVQGIHKILSVETPSRPTPR